MAKCAVTRKSRQAMLAYGARRFYPAHGEPFAAEEVMAWL